MGRFEPSVGDIQLEATSRKVGTTEEFSRERFQPCGQNTPEPMRLLGGISVLARRNFWMLGRLNSQNEQT